MANQKHVERLLAKAAVAGWNHWREVQNRPAAPLPIDNMGTGVYRMDDLVQESLQRVDLRWANFSGFNLSGVNLAIADLTHIKLTDTNLSGSNFRRAILQNAVLSGANLDESDLSETNLSGANLEGASLNGANLEGANLSGAILNGADLSSARLCQTLISNVDLYRIRNIETTIHSGPSAIDHQTLQKSFALPPQFLRGCGLPEKLISYYSTELSQDISYYSCFISHSHSDKVFARRLHDQLQGRGIRCWLDEHQVLPGDDIYEQVDEGIKLWDKVLLCASENALTSWWVDNEIDSAFSKEQKIMKQREKKVLSLIPLDLDGYMFSEWKSGKAEQVKSRLAADFKGWETDNAIFEAALEKTVSALQTDNTGREAPPTPKL